MSGFEIAGIVLGGIPLLISGLEHWREIANICGYYRHIQREHDKCVDEIMYNRILYKRNLEELLHPIVDNPDDVARLVKDPANVDWKSKALADRLEDRLQESYSSYMIIMRDMGETIEELKKALSLDKPTIQSRLIDNRINNDTKQGSVISIIKTKMNYQLFRLKFSFDEDNRQELFQRLQTNNKRLEKLLSTSDRISSLLQNRQVILTRTRPTSALNHVFIKARKSSELLFKAIQEAWQCPCKEQHFANLRLEHRTIPEICFEVILTFTSSASYPQAHWSWKELQCGQRSDCATEKKQLLKPPPFLATQSKAPHDSEYRASLPRQLKEKKRVASHKPELLPIIKLNAPVASSMKLCQTLGDHDLHECMGVIGTEEIYHLHPMDKRRPLDNGPCTLDHILSSKFVGNISRRQRYSIALLVASSVAQLQYTAWLRTGLTKKDILFYRCETDDCNIPFHEPFIRQGFRSQDDSPDSQAAGYNFYSLGILLLELCFGKRLEDYAPRQAYPSAPVEVKEACDTMAALVWSRSVSDESGPDYASAVSWCFTGAKTAGKSWRSDILKSVVQPLESCQEHFKITANA